MSMIIEIKKNTQPLKIKEPSLYNVIFHNDNVTTFEFVILVLMEIFHKNQEEALVLTRKVNDEGKAIIAQYPLEIAQIKKQLTDINSKKNQFPLVCELEKNS